MKTASEFEITKYFSKMFLRNETDLGKVVVFNMVAHVEVDEV